MATAPKLDFPPPQEPDDDPIGESVRGERTRHMADATEGEGIWLISYADLMTLLVGFFVIILSFSTIDAGKFEQLKKETSKLFGGDYQIPYEDLVNKLRDVVAKQGIADQVLFQQTDEGVIITFRGALFFDSGSADIRPQALGLLDQLVPIILQEASGMHLVVEGHTDNRPVIGGVFPSNWELSGFRSSTVIRLFEKKGFDRTRLRAIGWADIKPILPNEDSSGSPLFDNQAQNRRVVIKLLRKYD